MRLLSKFRPFAYHFQIFSHFLYIALSFRIHAQERPIQLVFSMILFAIALDWLLAKGRHQPWVFSLAAVGISNSIYLNMESYGFLYWPFFVAIAVALIARQFLRIDGRPVFNPSIVGVLFISSCFPEFGSAAMYAWNNQWEFTAIVGVLGLLVTTIAGTVRVSLSYLISFFVISFGTVWLSRYLGPILLVNSNIDSIGLVPLLSYPFSLLCFGNILFAFHGIGDPSTCPKDKDHQVLFGLSIGALDFFLRIAIVIAAPFVAYAIVLLAYAGLFLQRNRNYDLTTFSRSSN